MFGFWPPTGTSRAGGSAITIAGWTLRSCRTCTSSPFEVMPVGAGSQLSWTERLQLPLASAGRLAWPVLRPLLQRGMDASLRGFARLFPRRDPGRADAAG
jgi:hypothetical protein